MDIDEIRRMIRASVRAQVNDIVERRRQPPKTFREFDSSLQEALEHSGLEVLDHSTSYGLWESISSDMQGFTRSHERVVEWNSALNYYVSHSDLSQHVKKALLNRMMKK